MPDSAARLAFVEASELRTALVGLALEAGLEVRETRAAAGHAPPESSVCRVHGAVWVVLSSADPLERQLDVLAGALRTHHGAWLERRFLPPALRERLLDEV